MTTTGLTDASIVRRVVQEYDSEGRDAFLGGHKFERANQYYLQVGGRLYDAKAVANVAYRYEHQDPDARVISGGRDHSNRLLERLGFTLSTGAPPRWRVSVPGVAQFGRTYSSPGTSARFRRVSSVHSVSMAEARAFGWIKPGQRPSMRAESLWESSTRALTTRTRSATTM